MFGRALGAGTGSMRGFFGAIELAPSVACILRAAALSKWLPGADTVQAASAAARPNLAKVVVRRTPALVRDAAMTAPADSTGLPGRRVKSIIPAIC